MTSIGAKPQEDVSQETELTPDDLAAIVNALSRCYMETPEKVRKRYESALTKLLPTLASERGVRVVTL